MTMASMGSVSFGSFLTIATTFALSTIATTFALSSACRPSPSDIANGDDPMAALAQHVESARYGPEYWKRIADRDSALWDRATVFCSERDHTQYPTCAGVVIAEFYRDNTQPAVTSAPFSYRIDHQHDTIISPGDSTHGRAAQ